MRSDARDTCSVEREAFVLLDGLNSETIVAISPSGAAHALRSIGVPNRFVHSWSAGGHLAYPVRKGRKLQVWDASSSRPGRIVDVETPVCVTDLTWFGDNLIVVGTPRDGGLPVWVWAASKSPASWEPVDVPDDLRGDGEALFVIVISAATMATVSESGRVACYDASASGFAARGVEWVDVGWHGRVDDVDAGGKLVAVQSTSTWTPCHLRRREQITRSYLTLYRARPWVPIGQIDLDDGVQDWAMRGDELVVLAGGGRELRTYRNLSAVPAEESWDEETWWTRPVPALDIVPEVTQLQEPHDQFRRSSSGGLVLVSSVSRGTMMVDPR